MSSRIAKLYILDLGLYRWKQGQSNDVYRGAQSKSRVKRRAHWDVQIFVHLSLFNSTVTLSEQAKYLQKEEQQGNNDRHVRDWSAIVGKERTEAPRTPFLDEPIPRSRIQLTISPIWMFPPLPKGLSLSDIHSTHKLLQYTVHSYRPVDEELEDDEEGHHFFLSLGPIYAKLFVGPADRIPLRDWLNVGRRTMSWMLRSTTSLNSWSLTIFCHNRFSSVIVVWSTTPSTSPVLDLTTFHFLS